MADAFYPFVDKNDTSEDELLEVKYPARIAVYDDIAAAPRVCVVNPQDPRSYLEEITQTVVKLVKEQGGSIPFMVIREIVENYIHAYFIEPTISILNGGNTIRFSDQGPGIKQKERALEYGTTSATEKMKQYIRGVGSGLPYASQYMEDHGGCLTIDDNLGTGTIVTLELGEKSFLSHKTPNVQNVVSQNDTQEQHKQIPQNVSRENFPQTTTSPQVDGLPQGYVPNVSPASMMSNYPIPQTLTAYPMTSAQPMYAAYPNQIPQTSVMPGHLPFQMQQTQAAYLSPQIQSQPQLQTELPTQMPAQMQMPTQMPAQTQMPTQMPTQAQMPTQMPTQMPAQMQMQTPNPLQTPSQSYPQLTFTTRQTQILAYLLEHEQVGPTDLVSVWGGSNPTWSRELATLEEFGLLKKEKGKQKRQLTASGKIFASQIVKK